ncbi:MAG: DUF1697 domain-containing protein [Candidatus Dojkabacteria bacterium]
MTNPSTTYIALLRGINVGGHTIRMRDLIAAFKAQGFINVNTILASGNVVFDNVTMDEEDIANSIERKLLKQFGFNVPVLLRTQKDIQRLINSDPFKDIKVINETRLYVSFLSDKPKSNLSIPYESPEKDFKIIRVTSTEVCSVLTLSPERGTTDAMKILEKEYGKKITTRNWNTVLKLVKN